MISFRHGLMLLAFWVVLSPFRGIAQMPDPPGQVADGQSPICQAYLFAHMTDDDYGRLYYCVSRDALHWEQLNQTSEGPQRVFGEYRGHPDISRGHDGRFYLVGNQNDSAPAINFWVSDDLIHWQRYSDYTPDLKSTPDYSEVMQRIGAPKIFFDTSTGQYLLTWHTTHHLGRTDVPEPYWAGQRTLYVTSHDLKTFSVPPRRLFPVEANAIDREMATIDTIVRRVGDRYYAIFKDERYPTLDWPTGKTIRIRSATSLTGPYGEPGPPISPSFREAPMLIPSPSGTVWYLYYEQYPGVSYGLSVAEGLTGPWVQIAGNQRPTWDKFALPSKVRHGCMIEISLDEYDRLKATFPSL